VANRRHPNKSKSWIVAKYWKTVGGDNWVFGDQEYTLQKHHKTAIERHVKVKGGASPYDGDTLYWAKRKGKHPELSNSVAQMLKKQKGKCKWCNLTFLDGDIIETDHITPKALGGNNGKDNKQLLHKHCHDSKTSLDLADIKRQKESKGLKGTHTEPERREAV
jgi:RNA-directed DNA polymerase